MVGGRLVVFLMRVQAAGKGAFGFKVAGSVAVWSITRMPTLPNGMPRLVLFPPTG